MALPFETARLQALKELAAGRFGKIEPAEEEVLRLSAAAEVAYPPDTEEQPEVRAEFLRWLATDKDAASHIDPLGLRVANATVASAIDLDFCKAPFRLRFQHCTLKGGLYLRSAELSALYLLGCKAEEGISADGLRVRGNVFLRDLEGAGTIRLPGAEIGGDLACSGARLSAEGDALSADRAKVTGGVFLTEGFSCAGTIRLPGAEIGGNLDCRGATLSAEGKTLSADRARITGGVFLTEGFSCAGEVRLLGAEIGGDLDCSGATLSAEGNALSANGARITGNVFLTEGFSCAGEVRLLNAEIGGNLACAGARLSAEGNALSAGGAKVTGGVFLTEGFSCAGEIRLLGAEIGGDLTCSGATLSAERDALSADRAKVTGGVFLREGFSCSGTIRLLGAEIGGNLACARAKIRALVCQRMRLGGDLIWMEIQEPENTSLDLLGASMKTLHDDEESWPAAGKLVVKGLEYKDLVHHEPSTEKHLRRKTSAAQRRLDAEERIGWLERQDARIQMDPQAWMWLAKVFKEKDDVAGHRRIVREYRCRKAREGKNPLTRRAGMALAHLEENPLRILWAFVLLLAAGTGIFWVAAAGGEMPPTGKDAYAAWASGRPFPIAYPRFNPLVYALENELPVVRFGMDDKWAPDPNLAAHGRFWTYWFLAGARWLLILAGWVQGIVLTIGVSRRFRE